MVAAQPVVVLPIASLHTDQHVQKPADLLHSLYLTEDRKAVRPVAQIVAAEVVVAVAVVVAVREDLNFLLHIYS